MKSLLKLVVVGGLGSACSWVPDIAIFRLVRSAASAGTHGTGSERFGI